MICALEALACEGEIENGLELELCTIISLVKMRRSIYSKKIMFLHARP